MHPHEYRSSVTAPALKSFRAFVGHAEPISADDLANPREAFRRTVEYARAHRVRPSNNRVRASADRTRAIIADLRRGLEPATPTLSSRQLLGRALDELTDGRGDAGKTLDEVRVNGTAACMAMANRAQDCIDAGHTGQAVAELSTFLGIE